MCVCHLAAPAGARCVIQRWCETVCVVGFITAFTHQQHAVISSQPYAHTEEREDSGVSALQQQSWSDCQTPSETSTFQRCVSSRRNCLLRYLPPLYSARLSMWSNRSEHCCLQTWSDATWFQLYHTNTVIYVFTLSRHQMHRDKQQEAEGRVSFLPADTFAT